MVLRTQSYQLVYKNVDKRRLKLRHISTYLGLLISLWKSFLFSLDINGPTVICDGLILK